MSTPMRRTILSVLALAIALAAFAGPAQAAFKHPAKTEEFGPDGTSASTFSNLSFLAINKQDNRLYALAGGEEKIRAFDIPNGTTHAAVGGNFPITLKTGGGGDPDLAAENPEGVLWLVTESPNAVSGYNTAGELLAGFPIEGVFSDSCGGATDAGGNMWVSNYGTSILKEFTAGGATGETISVAATGSPCHIEFDRSTNDLYVARYNGPTNRYTASSGYTEHTLVDSETTSGLAFDATSHVLYVVHSSYIAAYNETGTLLENIGAGNFGYRDVAVDEDSGVLYATFNNKIVTFPGVVVPDVTTGEPVGNAKVSGTVDPAGGGNVTSCQVEYGTSPADYENHAPIQCEPPTPYSASQNVTANLPGLVGETTYSYRVSASNANGTNVGADRTITPHNVNALKTEAPIEVTRNCATLRASYVGEGETITFQFKYGLTAPKYGSLSPEPAGTHSGTGLQPLTSKVCGLTPGQTYHYKVVASNAKGESVADDVAFTTVTAVELLSTDPATNVASTSATLNGSWRGNEEDTHYFFEWGKSNSYGNVTAGAPGVDAGSGTGTVNVHFDLAGLNPSTTYHFRIVASNAIGTTKGADRTFTTLNSLPLVREFASDVHSESALINAEINPGGEGTSYHFEYGTADCSSNPCTSVPTEDVSIGGGNSYVLRSIRLEDLEPATTYHFRVVATNALGAGGYDATFTTFAFVPTYADPCGNVLARQQTGAGLLLDCRAYELVSAANSGGYDVESNLVPGQQPFAGFPDANSPSRVLYGVHNGAIPGVAGHPTNKGVDPYVATRGTTGWSTTYEGIASDNAFATGPFSSVPTGASAQLGTFAFGGSGSCSPCFEGGYTGIPVRIAGGQLVQAMTGTKDPGPGTIQDGLVRERLSADGTHLVFGSTAEFEPGASQVGDINIYDRDLVSGVTHVVSKAPDGGDFPCAGGLGKCNAGEGDSDGIAELAISADGSHILLGSKTGTDSKGNRLWHLYMNVGDEDHTVDLTPGATDGVRFAGMTADGATVFFTSTDQIEGTSDGDESADLFEATISTGGVDVTRLTPGDSDACQPALSDGGAQPHWNSLGADANCDAVAIGGGGGLGSSDGSVFFLSPEQLDGSEGVADQPNLYVVRPGDGPQFIATLSPDDSLVRDATRTSDQRRGDDFQVTADGAFAAFSSTVSLTGYANGGHTEVYRYAAGSGALDCASCNPANSNAISDATLSGLGSSLSSSGQVFFDSNDPLSLRDSDNVSDVYEWEPVGVGDCSTGSPAYSSVLGSCTSLVSSGISAFDSKLLGASADGTDVYFFTHDSLAQQDENGPITKLYDARVDGGYFAVPDPALCAASDECHGPSSQAPGAPDIKTVAGNPGNVTPQKPCGKGKVRRHGVCVKKKKGAKKKQQQKRHHHRGGKR